MGICVYFLRKLWKHNQYVLTKYFYRTLALRALGLLLADGAPTVGSGKTFCCVGQFQSSKWRCLGQKWALAPLSRQKSLWEALFLLLTKPKTDREEESRKTRSSQTAWERVTTIKSNVSRLKGGDGGHVSLMWTNLWPPHLHAAVYYTCTQVSITQARRCLWHLHAGVHDICMQMSITLACRSP